MEEICYSETSVSFYRSTQRYNPEYYTRCITPKRQRASTELHSVTTQNITLDVLLRNVGELIPCYTALQHRRLHLMYYSETSVSFYRTTPSYNPEDYTRCITPKRRLASTVLHSVTTKNITLYVLLRNVGELIPCYTALQPRRLHSMYYSETSVSFYRTTQSYNPEDYTRCIIPKRRLASTVLHSVTTQNITLCYMLYVINFMTIVY
jgi:hypothetical protein